MKATAFGYSRGEATDSGLLELSEVSFCAEPSELRTIAAFFVHCADMMDSNVEFGHEHLRDQPGICEWDSAASDVIIARRR
jgi:hypothetical protein